MTKPHSLYPPIDDYAFISDCHSTALISRSGAVDWCCMPRMDSDSCFGRLLDWNKGGHWSLAPTHPDARLTRRYLPGTMIMESRYTMPGGEVCVHDFFDAKPVQEDGHRLPPVERRHRLFRVIECLAGEVEMQTQICARLDYGQIIPMTKAHGPGVFSAVGSSQGLLVRASFPLQLVEHRDLQARFRLSAGERASMLIAFAVPEAVDQLAKEDFDWSCARICLEQTRRWWEQWTARGHDGDSIDAQTLRSTLVLRGLMYEPTGAIAAAATTSLPESIGAHRNWDYRFSWVRDSVFAVRALYRLGHEDEATRFMRFIQRASAGSARQLQIMYAVDGKRRLTEIELDWLEGYRRSRPVRIGNRAYMQNQLDVYGEVVELAWLWHTSGKSIDREYWDFVASVVDTVCEKWMETDHGIWEFRGPPRHFVHSKVMCWAALEHGLQLAQEYGFQAPLEAWTQALGQIRQAIESRGYDSQRGIFVQDFDSGHLDASLLLIPRTGFVDYTDARMVRTTDAICAALDRKGLLERYSSPDSLNGREGVFLPCTFWLATCLAKQGQRERAQAYYDRAMACCNDLGLFAEEYDVEKGSMLGNFPQALTHVSQIGARLALTENL